MSEANGHLHQTEFHQESTLGSPAAGPAPAVPVLCSPFSHGWQRDLPHTSIWVLALQTCRVPMMLGLLPHILALGTPAHTQQRGALPWKVLQVKLHKKAGQTEAISSVGFGWAHHPPVCTSLPLLSPFSSLIPCLFLFDPLRPFPFPTFAPFPKHPLTNLTCSHLPGRRPMIYFTQSPRALPLHPTSPVLIQAMAAWMGFTLRP